MTIISIIITVIIIIIHLASVITSTIAIFIDIGISMIAVVSIPIITVMMLNYYDYCLLFFAMLRC